MKNEETMQQRGLKVQENPPRQRFSPCSQALVKLTAGGLYDVGHATRQLFFSPDLPTFVDSKAVSSAN